MNYSLLPKELLFLVIDFCNSGDLRKFYEVCQHWAFALSCIYKPRFLGVKSRANVFVPKNLTVSFEHTILMGDYYLLFFLTPPNFSDFYGFSLCISPFTLPSLRSIHVTTFKPEIQIYTSPEYVAVGNHLYLLHEGCLAIFYFDAASVAMKQVKEIFFQYDDVSLAWLVDEIDEWIYLLTEGGIIDRCSLRSGKEDKWSHFLPSFDSCSQVTPKLQLSHELGRMFCLYETSDIDSFMLYSFSVKEKHTFSSHVIKFPIQGEMREVDISLHLDPYNILHAILSRSWPLPAEKSLFANMKDTYVALEGASMKVVAQQELKFPINAASSAFWNKRRMLYVINWYHRKVVSYQLWYVGQVQKPLILSKRRKRKRNPRRLLK